MTGKRTAVGSRPIPEPIRHDDRGIEESVPVRPEIQIPMVINRDETIRVVETPAAARSADTFAGDLQFLSYGVNDLTQAVLAISRDDTVHFMGPSTAWAWTASARAPGSSRSPL